jgi:RIO kinase 1
MQTQTAGARQPCGFLFLFQQRHSGISLWRFLVWNDEDSSMSDWEELNELDDLDQIERLYPVRNGSNRERKRKNKHIGNTKSALQASPIQQLAEQIDGFPARELTYNASRHEKQWIEDSLAEFFDQQWLDDILRLVKGGKEANVYQCLASPTVASLKQPFLAAKVYRPRKFRNLKNDHLYREGRTNLDSDGNQITDDGKLHAMAKRTEFGRQLLHTSWIEHEVKTMQVLFAAGADVPQVHASENNAILMTFVGDEQAAAPVLHGIRLERNEAKRLFDRVIHNIEIMLACQRVHGDLSAFNILYWEGQITIIDFPQAIDPRVNRNSYWIFERDVTKVCEYFSRQGVKSEARQLARGLWKDHHLRIVPDVHPKLLDSDNEADRNYWERWQDEG